MAQKFGGAFGSALILWLLAAYGYNTEADAVQSGQTLFGLRLLMSYLPAAGCALASLLLVFYPLTDRRMKHIAGELSIRRKTEDHE